jgi:hypothetical protein
VGLPGELLPAYQTTTGRGRRGGGAIRAALAGAGAGPVLDSAVAAAVRDALGAAEPSTLGARLATLAGVISALDLSAGSAPEADEDEPSAPHDANGDATDHTDEQSAEHRGPDAPDDGDEPRDESQGDAGSGDGKTSSEDGSSAATPGFDAKRRAAIQQALAGALRRWSALVPRLGTVGESTRTLLDRAAQHAPAPHALRAELFAGLGGLRDDLRAIGDPRRLLTTDFTDGLTLDVDPADFVLIVDALRRVAMEHGGTPKATVDSRWVGVALPRVVAGDSEGQGEDAEANDAEDSGAQDSGAQDSGAQDSGTDASDAGSGEDTAAGDEQSEQGSAVDSGPSPDKASAAPTLAEVMKAGYAADADEEARVLAFGEPGVPLLLRHLAKRNGLSISVGNVRKRPALVVKWNDGRR